MRGHVLRGRALRFRPGFKRAGTGLVFTLLLPTAPLHRASAGEPPGFEDYERAEKIAREVVERFPSVARAHIVLARALEARGKKPEAEEVLTRALSLSENPREKAEILDKLGHLASLRDDQESGIRLYWQAIQADPELTGVRRRLGLALASLGRADEAISVYHEEIELSPRDAMAHFLLGQALLDGGRAAEAKGPFERAVEIDPSSPNHHYGLGQCLLRLGDRERAKRVLNTFRELKKKEKKGRLEDSVARDDVKRARMVCHDIAVQAAPFYIGARETKRAAELLRRAAEDAPEAATPCRMLAILHLSSNENLEEALRLAETVVKISPSAASHDLLGWALFAIGKTTEAEKALLRAAQVTPESAAHGQRLGAPYRLLAVHHLTSRRNSEVALRLAETLVKIEPSAASHDLLGWALFANGRAADAEKAILEAIRLEPENPLYRERLDKMKGRKEG